MTHSIPQFLLIKRHGGRGPVFVAFGRLVLGHGAEWGIWAPYVENGSREEVYVDLSGVTELDAAGLGLLVRVARRIGRRGRDFCVVAASPRVRRPLALTRLEKPLASDCRFREVPFDYRQVAVGGGM